MEWLDRILHWMRRQRIGAALRPAYVKVLSFTVGLTAAVVTIITVLYRIPAPQAVSTVLVHALLQFGIVTAIFWAVQREQTVPAVDRYLEAVRDFLPRAQQGDIIRELSENIRSKMEDRAAELGRPLTEAEQEALLEQLGSPLLVASRFRQDELSVTFGRQLIGPALFPLYVKLLAFNVGLVVILLGLIPLAGGKPILRTLPLLLLNVGVQFTLVTLVFAVFNRFPDALSGWSPRSPRSPSSGE
jgi:hypothetical protein